MAKNRITLSVFLLILFIENYLSDSHQFVFHIFRKSTENEKFVVIEEKCITFIGNQKLLLDFLLQK